MKTPLRKTFQNPEYLQRSRRYDHKCVCEICFCGKHRCPEKGYQLQTETTNNFYYKTHAINPEKRERPSHKPLNNHYKPQDLQTSYKTSYSPHKIEPKDNTRYRKQEYKPSAFKLDNQTQYKKSYHPEKIRTEQTSFSPVKRLDYIPNTSKFEGTTTYGREFSPKKIPNEPSPRKRPQYQISKTPFQGQSTYKGNYIKPQAESYRRPDTAANKSSYIPSPNKFQGQSRYRQFHKQFDIKQKQRCPTEYLPNRPYRCSPGKDHLHYNANNDSWQ